MGSPPRCWNSTSVAGEGRRPANVNRVLPINFCGGPNEIVAQLKQCREQIGVGVVDLSFQTPGSEHPNQVTEAMNCSARRRCRTSATSEMAAGFREGFVEADGVRIRYMSKVGLQRVSFVALRPREGPLTEPTADAQPWPRERVLVPLCRLAPRNPAREMQSFTRSPRRRGRGSMAAR